MSGAQRVLITAGAGGIGLAITRAFAADGARVHVADVDPAAVGAVVGGSAGVTGTVCDVSDAAAVEAMVADAAGALGGVDVLVNNAGIAGPTSPVEHYDSAEWDRTLAVNLSGTFHVTRLVIPLLKRSQRGSIIVMSSLAGRVGYPNRVAYATTKWGLVGFAKTLALELGPYRITANAILPGGVAGPRVESVLRARAEVSGRSLDEERQLAMENQSVKHFVDPRDIAALVLFLAGEHGRSISGQILPIDGDSKAAQ